MPVFRAKCCRGFTLLETLIVIVIVAIMTGLTLLSVSHSSHKTLDLEAEKLKAVIDALRTEAVFLQTPCGLLIIEHGYRPLVWNHEDATWIHMAESKNYQLPSHIAIEPYRPNEAGDRMPKRHPAVVFYPDQSTQNFSIKLISQGEHRTIRGERYGVTEIVSE